MPGELPRDRLEELVPLLQSEAPGQGTASAVGRTLTWGARFDTNTSSQQISGRRRRMAALLDRLAERVASAIAAADSPDIGRPDVGRRLDPRGGSPADS